MNSDSTTQKRTLWSRANFKMSLIESWGRFSTNYSTYWITTTMTSWTFKRSRRWWGKPTERERLRCVRGKSGRRRWSLCVRRIRKMMGWSTGRSFSCFTRNTESDTVLYICTNIGMRRVLIYRFFSSKILIVFQTCEEVIVFAKIFLQTWEYK